jgi:hypothetical protein
MNFPASQSPATKLRERGKNYDCVRYQVLTLGDKKQGADGVGNLKGRIRGTD